MVTAKVLKSKKSKSTETPRANIAPRQAQAETLSKLYASSLPSSRSGAVFNAHSYPTKINTTPVIASIVAHTKPGDLILDGFAGSGVTALASALCTNPDPELKYYVEQLLGTVQWGRRDCVSYDISELACFITDSLVNPPNPKKFALAAAEVLETLSNEWGWLYGSADNEKTAGQLRHVIWTDHPICPHCGHASTYWELAVDLSVPTFNADVRCNTCRKAFDVSSAARVTESYFDDLLGKTMKRRRRTPVQIYGRSGTKLWKRTPTPADTRLIKQIEKAAIPDAAPILPMMNRIDGRWGELYRSGYHEGITHVHHFYTRRNLIAIAAAWQATEKYPPALRKALRFWISSYNSSHSTLMSRVVCKQSSKELVLTSGQPGALYISSLPVEKNVFAGLKAKLPLMIAAFEKLAQRSNSIEIKCASSLDLHLEDSSVDYIFIDPPFGNNIQYAEVNFIAEAWLGKLTKVQDEAIVSSFGGKSVTDYQGLLTNAFREFYRVLKPSHFMTVVFHSTTPAVWQALRLSWEAAGFEVSETSVLDKKQTSFKQTTTDGAVHGDCLILLHKPRKTVTAGSNLPKAKDLDPWKVVQRRINEIGTSGDSPTERTKQRLYNRLVSHYVERGQNVPLDANSFFEELGSRFRCRNGRYYLK